jgi:hypothetical protein
MVIESKCWIDDELKAHVQFSVDLEDIQELRDRDVVMQKIDSSVLILECLRSKEEIEHQIGVALYEENLVANVPAGKQIGEKIIQRLICSGTTLESLRKAITEVEE